MSEHLVASLVTRGRKSTSVGLCGAEMRYWEYYRLPVGIYLHRLLLQLAVVIVQFGPDVSGVYLRGAQSPALSGV